MVLWELVWEIADVGPQGMLLIFLRTILLGFVIGAFLAKIAETYDAE